MIHGIDREDVGRDELKAALGITADVGSQTDNLRYDLQVVSNGTYTWTVPQGSMWEIFMASAANNNRFSHAYAGFRAAGSNTLCHGGRSRSSDQNGSPMNAMEGWLKPIRLRQGAFFRIYDGGFQAGDSVEYSIAYYEVMI